MHVLETIVNWYAPHACVGCQAEGSILCAPCLAALPAPTANCYRCHRPSSYGLSCRDGCRQFGLIAVNSVALYAGAAKDIVWRLKFERARAAAEYMASALAEVCRRRPIGSVVVPLPTSPSRVRPRGYDQAVLLAKMTARRNKFAYASLLQRLGKQRQVGASRSQRYEQMDGAFRLRPRAAAKVQGRHVILVDDVITTGATAESAARLLRAAGARSVEAVSFARAHID